MSEDCSHNRQSLAVILKELRTANPNWSPGGVKIAARTFFEALAVRRQDVRLWTLARRLDLQDRKLELDIAKYKEALRIKSDLALDMMAAAIKPHPEALQHWLSIQKIAGLDKPKPRSPDAQTGVGEC
jgi:hypothetical protein